MNHWWCYPVALIAGAAAVLGVIGVIALMGTGLLALSKFIDRLKGKLGVVIKFIGNVFGWLGLTVAFPLILIKFGLEILRHFGYCTNVKFFL